MKKLTVFTFAVLLVIVLVGCGSKTAQPTQDDSSKSTASDSQSTTGGSDIIGVDDPKLAAALREVTKHQLYTEWVGHDVAASGILPPFMESRASIDKGITGKKYKPEEIKIAADVFILKNEWCAAVKSGIEAAAKEYGVKTIINESQGNQENAISYIENAITMGAKAYLGAALSGWEGANQVAKMAVEGGMIHASYGTAGTPEGQILTSFIPADFIGGVNVGLYAGPNFEGKHIKAGAIIGGFGSASSEARPAGMIAGLMMYRAQKAGMKLSREDIYVKALEMWKSIRDKGSAKSEEFDMEVVVAIAEGTWTEAGGMKAGEDIFAAHQDLNLMLNDNDLMGIGGAKAAEAAGLKLGEGGIWFISPSDGSSLGMEYIKQGKYLATGDSGGYMSGYLATKLILEVLINGYDANDLTYLTHLDPTPITKENLSEYQVEGYKMAKSKPVEVMTVAEYNKKSAEQYLKDHPDFGK